MRRTSKNSLPKLTNHRAGERNAQSTVIATAGSTQLAKLQADANANTEVQKIAVLQSAMVNASNSTRFLHSPINSGVNSVLQRAGEDDFDGPDLERFRRVRRIIFDCGGNPSEVDSAGRAEMLLIMGWPDAHIKTFNWAADGAAIFAKPTNYPPLAGASSEGDASEEIEPQREDLGHRSPLDIEIGHGARRREARGGSGLPELTEGDYEVERILESGSTRPQLVRFGDGSRKVIKFGKDEGHLRSEFLTNQLYEAAGIPVLDAQLVLIDGRIAQITDFVEDFEEPAFEDLVESPDFLRHVGADILLANWDMFKTDNWMSVDGRMVRSDVGGALDYRAQGDKKSDEETWEAREEKEQN